MVDGRWANLWDSCRHRYWDAVVAGWHCALCAEQVVRWNEVGGDDETCCEGLGEMDICDGHTLLDVFKSDIQRCKEFMDPR